MSGEAPPLIAHAIHEELIKHKRDAIEWGVVGGDYDMLNNQDGGSSLSLLKDKTGLGLGWGRTPRDGRGPKTLRSAWRDWAETEEFRTKFEVLTADEVERREMERDRATRFVASKHDTSRLWLILDSDDYGERHRSSRLRLDVGGSGNAIHYINISLVSRSNKNNTRKDDKKRSCKSWRFQNHLLHINTDIRQYNNGICPSVYISGLSCVEGTCILISDYCASQLKRSKVQPP